MEKLTNEEIVSAIQNGNRELMEQLWRQCVGFIRQQAIQWARDRGERPSFDVDDLTQAGYIALCEAVRDFQPERSSFLNYLVFFLKREFARAAGCYTASQAAIFNNSESLDAPAYSDTESDTTKGESIPVDEQGFEDVERAVFNQQLSDVLELAMGELPEKQRTAIELCYLRRCTYIQIAEALHCSTSRVGQLSNDGLKGLRNGDYAPTLSELLYGERNYYRHTGLSSWKDTGCSSPEWELLRKESRLRWGNIWHCVNELGMTMKQAKRLFPV